MILALDWLLFGSNLLSGALLSPVTIALGALAAFVATYAIERQRAGRSARRALVAALFGAAVVAVPLPVGGTLLGAWLLATSGLSRGPRR